MPHFEQATSTRTTKEAEHGGDVMPVAEVVGQAEVQQQVTLVPLTIGEQGGGPGVLRPQHGFPTIGSAGVTNSTFGSA